MARRARLLTVVAAGVGLTITALVAALPFLRFAYESATTRVAMEATQAVIATLVAYLVFGRFRRSRQLADLVLVYALGLSGAANVLAVVVRAATEDRTVLSPSATWSSQLLRLVGAAAFVAAALLPERDVRPAVRSGVGVGVAVLATSTVLTAIVSALDGWLPDGIEAVLPASGSTRPVIETHATLLGLQLAITALFVVASLGFLVRAERARDELMTALAAGLALAAVSRLNYFLYPSLYTTIVHTGDVLRLAFYLVLLAGAAREIGQYWRDRAEIAALEERRRLARELHDGLSQELAFIQSHAMAISLGVEDPIMLRYVATAAERALAESRQAFSALDAPPGDSLDVEVRRVVDLVAERAGLEVAYDLTPGIAVTAETGAELIRVAREAVTNVARHADARFVEVQLTHDHEGRLQLAVRDDGRGFDIASPGFGRFGLRSMRERAERLGGELRLCSSPTGTTVELLVPVV